MVADTGDAAPDVELGTDESGTIRPAHRKGRPLVLYFYPRDDTPGCTAQAKAFSELAADFAAIDTDVVGVSPDSADSHARFRTKHALSIGLASDERRVAAEAFGVWVEKSMYGKTYMGVERATFLIDGRGRIARIWRKVKVPGHAAEVLAAARDLAGAAPAATRKPQKRVRAGG